VGVPLNDSSSRGAVDMFLSVKAKNGKIEGESQDAGGHKNEIEVLSWAWGMQAKHQAGGGTVATGRATIRELVISKRVDKASTALMAALRHNDTIKQAVLTIRKFGKTPLEFLTITIEDGRVVSFDIESAPASGTPEVLERVAFTFNKLSIVYTPQSQDGQPGGKTFFDDEWQAG
jgi:type VI secretion system secreted protein Hcp